MSLCQYMGQFMYLMRKVPHGVSTHRGLNTFGNDVGINAQENDFPIDVLRGDTAQVVTGSVILRTE